MIIDTIPDIHGQHEKLLALLAALGYTQTGGTWRAPHSDRGLVFLGDLIDRGRGQREVLDLVRALEDAGLARRVLGNHEMNGLHWAMERDGVPVRRHSPANQAHHQAFLDAFAGDTPGYMAALDWLAQAPFVLHDGPFVFVHAFWTPQIEADAATALGPGLHGGGFDALANTPGFLDAGVPTGIAGQALDLLTKGPESSLPAGFSIATDHGIVRTAVRRAWWAHQPTAWMDGCASVPEGSIMPEGAPPVLDHLGTIPQEARVLFGHYWRRDLQLGGSIPAFQRRFVCLDQSAGAGGDEPLVALTIDTAQGELPLDPDETLRRDAVTVVR